MHSTHFQPLRPSSRMSLCSSDAYRASRIFTDLFFQPSSRGGPCGGRTLASVARSRFHAGGSSPAIRLLSLLLFDVCWWTDGGNEKQTHCGRWEDNLPLSVVLKWRLTGVWGSPGVSCISSVHAHVLILCHIFSLRPHPLITLCLTN